MSQYSAPALRLQLQSDLIGKNWRFFRCFGNVSVIHQLYCCYRAKRKETGPKTKQYSDQFQKVFREPSFFQRKRGDKHGEPGQHWRANQSGGH